MGIVSKVSNRRQQTMTVLYLKNFTGKVEASGSISLTEEPVPTKPKTEVITPAISTDFIKDFQRAGLADCNLDKAPGIYIFTYSANGHRDYPFYIGESAELSIRLGKGDHLAGKPQVMDPTGFKVKETISYLQQKGLTVSILYKYEHNLTDKQNAQRRELERKIQQHLENSGFILINRKEGFAIKKGMSAEEKKQRETIERAKIHSFCDEHYGKDYVNVA
jgi:hypothetical protein